MRLGLLPTAVNVDAVRSKNAESYVPPVFQVASNGVEQRCAAVMPCQATEKTSTNLDERRLVPEPNVERPVLLVLGEPSGVGEANGGAPIPPRAGEGVVQIVGADALAGLAGRVPVGGATVGAAGAGMRVHPGRCGVGVARKYDDGLFLRPSFTGSVTTAMTATPQSAQANVAAAFALAVLVW